MSKPHLNKRRLVIILLLLLGPLLTLPILFAALGTTARAPHRRHQHPPQPPRLAYMISGGAGDAARIRRLLRALYHPWNYYLIGLGGGEAVDLEDFSVARRIGNVRVVREWGPVSARGPTEVAQTLHGVAILLREFEEWSWFINLSVSDYPLMTQDDILHILSYMPRDLNFIEHTGNIGSKEFQRARPIILDPALYISNKTEIVLTKEKRSMPSAFKIFLGSSLVILSRSFLQFCMLGWDNLPRTLLMYYTNFLSSSEGYFHTVICNSKYFQNTTVNNDLRFMMWDNPPRQHPINLTTHHFNLMANSGAPFARAFAKNDPVLDRIDADLLTRAHDRFTPGGWCLGSSLIGRDPCAAYGKSFVLRPTPRSRKLEKLVLKLLEADNFRSKQCK